MILTSIHQRNGESARLHIGLMLSTIAFLGWAGKMVQAVGDRSVGVVISSFAKENRL
jgi:hypothetical protein